MVHLSFPWWCQIVIMIVGPQSKDSLRFGLLGLVVHKQRLCPWRPNFLLRTSYRHVDDKEDILYTHKLLFYYLLWWCGQTGLLKNPDSQHSRRTVRDIILWKARMYILKPCIERNVYWWGVSNVPGRSIVCPISISSSDKGNLEQGMWRNPFIKSHVAQSNRHRKVIHVRSGWLSEKGV
jgi:hypothetical protein